MAAATDESGFHTDCSTILEELTQRCVMLQQCTSHPPDIAHSLKNYHRTLASLKNIPNISSQHDLSVWLKEFSRMLFDVTHVEENLLVEEEFISENSVNKMNWILKMLDSTLRLSAGEENDISKLLGEEIVECVHWRKGALCYMYCATIANDGSRCAELGEDFVECTRDGVKYLQEMLNTRKPLIDQRSDVSVNCEEVFDLVKSGIYSDTHVLAIMYMGELSYWYLKYTSPPSTDEERIQMRNIGKKQLELYISLTEAPLQGWDATRAKQLLTMMMKMT